MAVKAKTHYNNGNEYASESCCSNSLSPPPSPPRQSNALSRCRRRVRFKSQSSFSGAILSRRNLRYLLVLSLFYISVLFVYVGPLSALFGQHPPGAVYRSHLIFQRLWPDIQSDNSSMNELSSIWQYNKTRRLKELKPCPSAPVGQHAQFESLGPSGYLIVEANGGLNQQRSAICNAVAVAGLLNAILVIPHFEFNSVWRDPSKFNDIYDEDHFITTLKDHVKVVKELPSTLLERYDYNISNISNYRIQAWASVGHYTREVYPVLRQQGVIRIAPFANRLAMSVPSNIQLLRCLSNYQALRFSSPISTLAKKVVDRMVEKSSGTGGKYVSIHLRFEEDMVAFSCCVYDGGKAETFEMDSVRERGWGKKFKRKDHVILPGLNRIQGKCPLTPLEVGMMLRGMGFGNNTSIYLASGKIYQEDKYLRPLLKMFPKLYTKETLASQDELAPFKGYSSRLAALDYTVCLLSEVFVTTQGGNFPHFLMGHRRFLYGGHAKTIKPDKSKLVLLLQDESISWQVFKDQMQLMLAESIRKGMIIQRVQKLKRKSSVYNYPLPECRCLQRSMNNQTDSTR